MIKDDHKTVEAVANYFWVVFTRAPFLDEELDPNRKSTNLPLTADVDQKDIFKAHSTLDTAKSTGLD